ncbi:hypothetical protein [Pseudarthrobacter sp. NamB4]|uniref:hypothetical protein n=1 Tax=Pseudarthrobacter sp. NamB4 TaxID=2576837 RepID=UPI0010FED6E0|nr:hypothetical protein [Pseudarthrobacter sp. NamB4]TLM72419.1 hypothetical protein FDW81_12890 [Pseudarthrobacter sp. NamB4]
MNITRNDVTSDILTSGGKAQIRASADPLTAEQRALSPALTKAYAAIEEQNAAAQALTDRLRKVIAEKNVLWRSRNSYERYDQEREDELNREIRNLERALRRNESLAKERAIEYLVLAWNDPHRDRMKAEGANLALEAHADAVAALAALEEALARREKFYASAGRPAIWRHHSETMSVPRNAGQVHLAHQLIAREVNEFPAADLKTVVEGGQVKSLAEIQAEQQQALTDATAKMKAAARERDRRRVISERNN